MKNKTIPAMSALVEPYKGLPIVRPSERGSLQQSMEAALQASHDP